MVLTQRFGEWGLESNLLKQPLKEKYWSLSIIFNRKYLKKIGKNIFFVFKKLKFYLGCSRKEIKEWEILKSIRRGKEEIEEKEIKKKEEEIKTEKIRRTEPKIYLLWSEMDETKPEDEIYGLSTHNYPKNCFTSRGIKRKRNTCFIKNKKTKNQ